MTIVASIRIRIARPSLDQALLDRLLSAGGVRVPAHNPYWDAHGVTLTDPDGHRLVLSTRSWSPGTVSQR
ncbi:hypothetical protein ABZ470_33405 [Streptosporangium sp. NPDC020072]|uniref:hypothetical protein n=1 Tax=Streptosporangium sp. NPDC020072 TaxID=3154788 RepID=UPI003428B983